MKKTIPLVSMLCLALVCAAFTPNAQAIELISNLPGNDGTQSASLGPSRVKGMGFTMPGDAYSLVSLTMRLQTYGAGTAPIVEIWSDAGGVPGTSLITLNNPSFAPSGIANYDFVPPAAFTLLANTTYWIVAYGPAGAPAYDWKASSPAVTPTGLATHAGARWGTSGPPPTGTSSIVCSYAVDVEGAVAVDSESWTSIKAKYHD
jgi:hypothetical protein